MKISLKNDLRQPPWRHHLDNTPFRSQTQEECFHLSLPEVEAAAAFKFLVCVPNSFRCDLDAHYPLGPSTMEWCRGKWNMAAQGKNEVTLTRRRLPFSHEFQRAAVLSKSVVARLCVKRFQWSLPCIILLNGDMAILLFRSVLNFKGRDPILGCPICHNS